MTIIDKIKKKQFFGENIDELNFRFLRGKQVKTKGKILFYFSFNRKLVSIIREYKIIIVYDIMQVHGMVWYMCVTSKNNKKKKLHKKLHSSKTRENNVTKCTTHNFFFFFCN